MTKDWVHGVGHSSVQDLILDRSESGNYESIFFTKLLKNESQSRFAFVSSPLRKHFLGINIYP